MACQGNNFRGRGAGVRPLTSLRAPTRLPLRFASGSSRIVVYGRCPLDHRCNGADKSACTLAEVAWLYCRRGGSISVIYRLPVRYLFEKFTTVSCVACLFVLFEVLHKFRLSLKYVRRSTVNWSAMLFRALNDFYVYDVRVYCQYQFSVEIL